MIELWLWKHCEHFGYRVNYYRSLKYRTDQYGSISTFLYPEKMFEFSTLDVVCS